jgi:hypothetical protein
MILIVVNDCVRKRWRFRGWSLTFFNLAFYGLAVTSCLQVYHSSFTHRISHINQYRLLIPSFIHSFIHSRYIIHYTTFQYTNVTLCETVMT